MAADPSHLTELYETDVSLKNYCAGCMGPDQHCYSETISGVNNGVRANMGHFTPEEDMSIASSTDDSVAAAAVFRHLDNLIRHKIDDEIEQLKSNVNRILSEQQQEFAQAFGLHDDHSSSETSTSHVVPQSNYGDDASSDDCQLLMEDNSDCEVTMIGQYDYEEPLCSNCKGPLRNANTTGRQDEENKEDEEKIVMNYLLRLMTASSAMANTLKRKEYRT